MKKVLIYGLGKTGTELVKFCKRRRIPFLTFDDKINKNESFCNYLKKCTEIVVSPGVGLRNSNIREAIKLKKTVISEIEFASRFISKPIVAITGTNGKTTTTLLTSGLLESSGLRVFTGGNIGTPLIKAVNKQNDYDIILLETSSFQLQFIGRSFRPSVSAILNISENHLDHHFDMEEYISSKMNIIKNQDENCHFICADKILSKLKQKSLPRHHNPYKNINIKLIKDKILINEYLSVKSSKIKLLGQHNLTNILFALNIFEIFQKITKKQISFLENFSSPDHRLEIVNKRGTIINDSKSTSPLATEVALKSIQKDLVLIMGGKDKELKYNSLLPLVNKKVKLLVLYGENKFELAKLFKKNKMILAVNLSDAVKVATKNKLRSQVLLFSPGTSSFDQFKSFAERGEKFKEYVKRVV
ncbi:MAG: UDP-N-acetylmuramoyl-L-alanine--D-glutamate ligase [Thermodesulfobacteriota bacterium]|nr:MAG: UDP-N-acetylmuramoyl-L-alanine--D-glutamate ligase [Candidatus Dadabacteria bacterium]